MLPHGYGSRGSPPAVRRTITMRALLTKLRGAPSNCAAWMRELWRGPNWWAVPLLFFLGAVLLLVVLLHVVPAVAPFVYTVF